MADAPGIRAREVIEPQAPLRRHPSPDAALDTEALKGEHVTIDETTPEGWCHGTLADDGYAGWLPANALARPGEAATHKVAVPRTLVFPGPSIKLPPIEALSLGCRLAIVRIAEPFAVTATGGHVSTRHLAPIDDFADDPVAVAETFLNVPYLWGGKTSFGIDCSGLVQLALTACGIACPRDSHTQEAALGRAVSMGASACDLSALSRGDLMFWKGHVAMVRDRDTLIHANAFHMVVAIEPITEALARIAATGTDFTSVRRIER
ncbi:MAG TPA: NlpC/P60 family protein [Xanthobacteraceae bacterium]|nr:NlpC/P60 family protein [Xanthobacteraceae bacterium]